MAEGSCLTDFKTEGDARVSNVMLFNNANTQVSIDSLRFEGVKLPLKYSLVRFKSG